MSFADTYYDSLVNTMSEGVLMGMYTFMTGMGLIAEEADVKDKVQFISTWIWGSWADEEYYEISTMIWEYGFGEAGICTLSEAAQCTALKYYWMLIMTLNVFLSVPIAHAGAIYEWVMDYYGKFMTILGWL